MKTILFVCGHNAGRSQMAEAWFNHKVKGENVIAKSAGTHPGDVVNPVVVELLEEDGVTTSNLHPKMVDDEMLNEATEIFTMGCGVECAYFPGKVIVDLDLDDPHGQGREAVEPIYAQMKEKLASIIQNYSE